MSTTYEVRQKVSTIARSWQEVVFASSIERIARQAYDNSVRENPQRYFELIKITHAEDCLAFTPWKD